MRLLDQRVKGERPMSENKWYCNDCKWVGYESDLTFPVLESGEFGEPLCPRCNSHKIGFSPSLISDNDEGFFVITRVHRDDLVQAGFPEDKVNELTDDQMRKLAELMANGYLEDLFWVQIDILLTDYFGLEKNEEEDDE